MNKYDREEEKGEEEEKKKTRTPFDALHLIEVDRKW